MPKQQQCKENGKAWREALLSERLARIGLKTMPHAWRCIAQVALHKNRKHRQLMGQLASSKEMCVLICMFEDLRRGDAS